MGISYFRPNAPSKEIYDRILFPLLTRLRASKNGLDVEIREHKSNRTNAQNRFYWSTVKDIVDVLNDGGLTYGEWNLSYTSEILHEINKRIFGISSTSKLSKSEFCDLMDKLQSFWIEKTNGFYMPRETPSSYFERTGMDFKEQKGE